MIRLLCYIDVLLSTSVYHYITIDTYTVYISIDLNLKQGEKNVMRVIKTVLEHS